MVRSTPCDSAVEFLEVAVPCRAGDILTKTRLTTARKATTNMYESVERFVSRAKGRMCWNFGGNRMRKTSSPCYRQTLLPLRGQRCRLRPRRSTKPSSRLTHQGEERM